MKRIGLLIPNLSNGGAEKVVSQISFVLSETYEVYLIVFDGESVSYDYRAEFIDLKCPSKPFKLRKIFNVIKRVNRLNSVKNELQLDMVISFLRAANIVNYFSNKKGRKLVSCRGYSDFKKSSSLYAKMLKKVDGIIFPSKVMHDEFIQKYNISTNKVFMLYNPINISKINNLKTQMIDTKIENFMNEHKVIATLGSFKKDKGFWHLLKVFKLIKLKIPDAGLIFIGNNGDLEENIKNMAKNSGYEEDILFVGFRENPFNIIHNSDIFAMSSLNEGFPNALVEAMACGIPVVSTDCKSGPREILLSERAGGKDQEKCGTLVPVFSNEINIDFTKIDKEHEIMANAIEELLNNDLLITQYKKNTKEKLKEFHIENFKKNIISIIETVLN